MDILNLIKSRRSIRSFKPDPIPKEDLMKVLEAARWAPSAGNCQPWDFIVVTRDDLKRRLAIAALGQFWITEAPVIIVVCANIPRTAWRYGERGRSLYVIQDTAAATQNILLTAHALGYGTCWVGAFDEEEVKRALNIPRDVRPVAIIPLGKPNEKPIAPPRIPLEEIIHWETY